MENEKDRPHVIEMSIKREFWSDGNMTPTMVELIQDGQVIRFHCIDSDHALKFFLRLEGLIENHTVNGIKSGE